MLDKTQKIRLQSKIFTLFNTVEGKEVLRLLKEDMFVSNNQATDRDIFIDEGRRRLISYFENIVISKQNQGE